MIAPVLFLTDRKSPEGSRKKKRVLLVDTCREKRELRSEIMRRLGIEVDCAADISEGRGWWRPDLYDLVLFHMEDDQGHREKFCEDIRSVSPRQQIAFLVGKPEYLASSPKGNGDISFHQDFDRVPSVDVNDALSSGGSAGGPQPWGILEACRRISAVRSVSDARSKAIRARPLPPRDSEIRPSKRTTETTTLDDLVREEMK